MPALPTPSLKPTCSNCCFWNELAKNQPGELTAGECRVNPPTLIVIPKSSSAWYPVNRLVDHTYWPVTRDIAWCGRHSRSMGAGI